jgi:hypothetical protein
MGRVARNFGNGGGGGDSPLEPYYSQLIDLANSSVQLLALAPNYFVINLIATQLAQPIVYELHDLATLTHLNLSWLNNQLAVPTAKVFEFLRIWEWGAGKGYNVTFKEKSTYSNNQGIRVRWSTLEPPVEYFREIEFKVDETYVPTPDFITVDISGATTPEEVASAFFSTINGLPDTSFANTINGATVYFQQVQCTAEMNADHWNIVKLNGIDITVTYTDAYESFGNIKEGVSELNELRAALKAKVAAVDITFDPTSPTDLDLVVAGRTYKATPGTKFVRPDRLSWTFKGRKDDTYPAIFKPDFSIVDTELVTGVPVAFVNVPIDPNFAGAGNNYGPFELQIDGYTKCTYNVCFELALNGVRLLAPGTDPSAEPGIYGKGIFNRIDNAGVAHPITIPNYHNNGINLIGDGRHNNLNAGDPNSRIYFSVRIKCFNPFSMKRYPDATQSPFRYFSTRFMYQEDRYSGSPDNAVTGELWYRDNQVDPVIADAFIGPIDSIGIIGLEYSETSEYVPSSIIASARATLIFP